MIEAKGIAKKYSYEILIMNQKQILNTRIARGCNPNFSPIIFGEKNIPLIKSYKKQL